ncbi:MAG: cell wall-binding repeat-containing protein [Actinomycetota bacterium]|nr:MAG: N-acetylmuramoyl-L-alanine [Actinomycetota bacterium]MDO8950573.1 cell wall-binding repeat-containing protein [Actinomycetota bacterium]MDP3629568.1 cell wall-binding repeat-containing protein [Actinomycetota bacterium]
MHRSPRPALRSVAVVTLALVMAFATASPAFAAMSRSLVMQRAQTWVDFVIPYSQSAYRDMSNNAVGFSSGWRTDCSGFVSMSWNTFKPGYSTRTLQQTSTRITKEALQPGDALIAYNYHAVIFGGWADAERTQFYEYQMGSEVASGDGTGMHIEEYPGYSPPDRPYYPYRLNGITENIDYAGHIEPIEGMTRYSTALAASRSAFATGSAGTVIVASGDNWPDALGASALAGAVGGPVLLTRPDSLPAEVSSEIARLGAHEVIVVGGTGAVSAKVFRALDDLASVTPTRVAGGDRYSTAARVARETVRRLKLRGPYDGTVFITTGTNFPDALAASSLAAKSGWPILLTQSGTLSSDTSAAIAAIGASSAIILGGTAPVSASIEASLVADMGSSEVTRVAGINRYDTAFRIAEYGMTNCGLGVAGVAIATGTDFPDALAGGVMAGRGGTLLLLTPPGSLDPDVAELLLQRAAEVGVPRVLGGTSAVRPIVREAIALALGVE